MNTTRKLVAALLGTALTFAAPTMATGLRGGSYSSVTLHQGPIAATVTARAAALKRPAAAPAAETVGASVEFRFWAQSQLGPLSLMVFSHSQNGGENSAKSGENAP